MLYFIYNCLHLYFNLFPAYSETFNQIPPNVNQVVILQQMFYEEPVRVVCQHCGADIVTSTRYKNGTATWLAAAVMCFIG